MTSTTLKATHSDNFVTYTRADTTLVLCAKSFALTQANANVKTRRLIIYADAVIIGNQIESRGKEIHVHCNSLQFERSEGGSINLQGIDGINTAAKAPQDIKGQKGGSLLIHVHNLPIRPLNSNSSPWPTQLKINVAGGAAGRCHAEKSEDWVNGSAGSPGQVSLLYGNSLLRAVASLKDFYGLSTPFSEKLNLISTKVLPILRDTSDSKEIFGDLIQALSSNVDDSLSLHTSINQCLELLGLLENVGDSQAKVTSAITALRGIQGVQEYSVFVKGVAQDLKAIYNAAKDYDNEYRETNDRPSSSTVSRLSQSLDSFQNSYNECQKQMAGGAGSVIYPLFITINAMWKKLSQCREKLEKDFEGKVNPSLGISVRPVSFSLTGLDDLLVDVPLVHPDQCQMMMQLADAAFFEGNHDGAFTRYCNLLERLAFVPALLEEQHTRLTDPSTESSVLYEAFQRLEKVEQLSHWTVETLSYIHAQVCGRLHQMRLGSDMFGQPIDWAPRLSYQYYSDSAEEQLERLKSYEKNYWDFFDAYQAQMEASSVLREAVAVNVYRSQQLEEDIQRAMQTILEKEKSIKDKEPIIKALRQKLEAQIQRVKGLMDKWHMPSAGTICTTIASTVVIGAFLLSNPIGWAVIGVAVVAGGTQLYSVVKEASETMEDASGQRVNKKYVINQLSKCDGDLKSLMDKAYQMQDDGSKKLDEDDTKKVAVTEQQLKAFLEQFKGSIPEAERGALSKALDEFVKATRERNQDILQYNNAVVTLYQKNRDKLLSQRQASEMGSEMIKEDVGLPSVVAYYQRLRGDTRLAILRTIKQGALALRFWGLVDLAKFSSPSLLSTVDELYAHTGVLSRERESCLSRFGSFSQSTWPRSSTSSGIMYRLGSAELAALKIKQPDRHGNGVVHTVTIEGLAKAVKKETGIVDSPFAGRSNIRLNQVRVWIPGIKAGTSILAINIEHGGSEVIVDPDNQERSFSHHPVYTSFEYEWENVHSVADFSEKVICSNQVLASDWESSNGNAKVQAAIGPLTFWTLSIRSSINGELDFEGVENVYLEFHGSNFPFRR